MDRQNKGKGVLAIITGPPAAGKDTVVDGLLSQHQIPFKKIVTHTTREMRENEKHGIDYNFVSESEFLKLVENGELIEHVYHGSSWKGTHKEPFEAIIKSEENYIWRIDPSRAATVDELFIDKFGADQGTLLYERTVVLYIDVEDHTLLAERWLKRNSGADLEEFRKRLQQDLDAFSRYQHKFVNKIYNQEEKEMAIEQAIKIISSHPIFR